MTWNQLSHEQDALVRAHADNDVSRMLKGVVSKMHLLAKLSREPGFRPYVGHAHYIYACYLKSQINSSRPPSECDLVTPSGFGQGHATKACALGHETLFVTSRSGWHNFSCHSGTPRSRRWVHIHYCGCDIQIHSVVDISDGSDVHVVSEEHATAWETSTFRPFIRARIPSRAGQQKLLLQPLFHMKGRRLQSLRTPHFDRRSRRPISGRTSHWSCYSELKQRSEDTKTPPLQVDSRLP